MRLLGRGLAVKEHGGLAEVVEEALAAPANLRGIDPFGIADESAIADRSLRWVAVPQRIRLIGDAAPIDHLPHMPVSLMIVQWSEGSIDGDLVGGRAAQPAGW